MSDKTKPQFMVDNAAQPLVIWWPETRQIEVRVETAMLLSKCHAPNVHLFEEFKAKVYDRLNAEFNQGDMNTLVHARLVLLIMVADAKEKGELTPLKDVVLLQ